MKTLFDATGEELDEAVRVVTAGAPLGLAERGDRSDEDHRLIAVIHTRDSIAAYRVLLDTAAYQGMAPSRQLRQVALRVGVAPQDGESDKQLSERIVAAVVDWLRRVLLPPPRPTA